MSWARPIPISSHGKHFHCCELNWLRRDGSGKELICVFHRYKLKQFLLARWLMHETEALVIGRATVLRLKFEARTWQRTYAQINNQVDKCLADVGEFGSAIDGWLADSTAGRLTVDAQETIKTACKDEFPNTLKSHACLIP